MQIGEGRNEAKDTFFDIPATEHFLTVQNGDRGIRKLDVLVNNEPAATCWLRDRTVRTVDIAPYLRSGDNTVFLIANGRPGSSALVLISDAPGPDSGAKLFQPLVGWEQGSAEPGVSMHWGS